MAKKQPTSIDAHIGSCVRLRRMQIGMSQEKLAGLLGLTFQQIQKYEKGTNRIGAGRLYEIAHLFGIPVSYFFEHAPQLIDDEGVGRTSVDADNHILKFASSPEGFQLARAFMKVSDSRVRKRMIELVESLTGDAVAVTANGYSQHDGGNGEPHPLTPQVAQLATVLRAR